MGNDLIVTIDFYDDFTASIITGGTARIRIGTDYYMGIFSSGHYQITIPESDLTVGLLSMEILLNREYFLNTTEMFTVNVINKNEIRITPTAALPSDITTGETYTFSFVVEFLTDGETEWLPISGDLIYFELGDLSLSSTSDSTGTVSFTFTAPSTEQTLAIRVSYLETYDTEGRIFSQDIIIAPEQSNWLPYAGIGGGGFVIALFSVVLVSKRRKKKKSQKMVREVDKKIEEKDITEEEENFEDLLEKEKESEKEKKDKVDTEDKQEESPKKEEEPKDSKETTTEETIVEEKKGKSKKQKDTSEKEESKKQTQKKPAEDSLVETKREEISFNLDDPIEENIEKMTLHQISEKTYRSKNDLWKSY